MGVLYTVCIVQAQPYVWLGQKVMAVVAQEQQMALRSVQKCKMPHTHFSSGFLSVEDT
jgi:hypothetical protein